MRICFVVGWTLMASGLSGRAATAIYTDLAAFLAAVTPMGGESFDGLPEPGNEIGEEREFNVGGIRVVASTGSDLYTAGSAPDIWLSTVVAEQQVIDFDFSGETLYAVGGNFFTSDVSGDETPGSVELMTNDLTTHTVTYSSMTSFVGFVSDQPITRLSLVAVQPGDGPVWPTANNLVFGGVSVVPEPESAMIQGLVGWAGVMLAWRRKRR